MPGLNGFIPRNLTVRRYAAYRFFAEDDGMNLPGAMQPPFALANDEGFMTGDDMQLGLSRPYAAGQRPARMSMQETR